MHSRVWLWNKPRNGDKPEFCLEIREVGNVLKVFNCETNVEVGVKTVCLGGVNCEVLDFDNGDAYYYFLGQDKDGWWWIFRSEKSEES